ncbi:MAG: hypothetical protein KKD31_06540, partial [Bacteroidetes bacterium]|nr:hypothetical protein [Bacteroidota bacterium]
MEMNFSFGGNFAKLIGEHLLLHFPYIRKVICIHAPQSDNVTAFFSERLMNDIFTGIPDISDATSQLQPLIMNNRNATWFTDNELPFSHERVRAQTGWQIPVFNELERNILLIRQSSEDGIDLLFMYFSPVISGVSQAAQHPGLSTSEKQIIGAIFSHFLSFWQEMVENDRLAFSTLSRKIREMNEAVISLKTHLGNEQNTS